MTDTIAKFVQSYRRGDKPMIDEPRLRAAVAAGSGNEIRVVLSEAGLFPAEAARFFRLLEAHRAPAPATTPPMRQAATDLSTADARARTLPTRQARAAAAMAYDPEWRRSAILTCPEAAGRQDAARRLAEHADAMTLEAARGFLKIMPFEAPDRRHNGPTEHAGGPYVPCLPSQAGPPQQAAVSPWAAAVEAVNRGVGHPAATTERELLRQGSGA